MREALGRGQWGSQAGIPGELGTRTSGRRMQESRGCPGVRMTEAQERGDLEPWTHAVLEPRIAEPIGCPLGAWNSRAYPFPGPWWWSLATDVPVPFAPGTHPPRCARPFQI